MRGPLHIPFPACFFVARLLKAGRLLILMLGLAGLAGCSSRTTVSEWSCPTDQPEGCFSVAEGDARAIAALKGANSSAANDPATGTGRTVVRRMTLPVPISSGGAETQWFDAEGWPLRPEAGQTGMDGTGASSSGRLTKNPSSGPSLATASAGEAGRDTGRDTGHDARHADRGQEPIDLTVFAGGSQVGTDGTTYHAPSGESLRTPSSGDMTASGGTILTRAAPVTPAPALVRIPERLAEIWIGPFEDAEGNFHPAGRLFIVITPARWAPAGTTVGTTISPAYGHEDIYSREGIYDREDRR